MQTAHLRAGSRLPRRVDLRRGPRLVVAATGLIVGIGGLFGGYGLLSDADGLGAKQSWLDGSPFPDYTVPGLFLLVVIGGGMLAVATLALLGRSEAAAAAVVMGVVILAWGIVETLTVGWRGGPQVVLLALFVIAPAIVLIGIGRASLRGR
jgi:hypothetical protein